MRRRVRFAILAFLTRVIGSRIRRRWSADVELGPAFAFFADGGGDAHDAYQPGIEGGRQIVPAGLAGQGDGSLDMGHDFRSHELYKRALLAVVAGGLGQCLFAVLGGYRALVHVVPRLPESLPAGGGRSRCSQGRTSLAADGVNDSLIIELVDLDSKARIERAVAATPRCCLEKGNSVVLSVATNLVDWRQGSSLTLGRPSFLRRVRYQTRPSRRDRLRSITAATPCSPPGRACPGRWPPACPSPHAPARRHLPRYRRRGDVGGGQRVELCVGVQAQRVGAERRADLARGTLEVLGEAFAGGVLKHGRGPRAGPYTLQCQAGDDGVGIGKVRMRPHVAGVIHRALALSADPGGEQEVCAWDESPAV